MFTFSKNRKLFDHLEDYYKTSRLCLEKFHEAIDYIAQHQIDEHFEVMVKRVDELEQNCDDIRRGIEQEMFSESLLPETREDLFEIIEKLDHIPNHCENASYIILDQGSSPIHEIKKDMLELTKVGVEAFDHTIEAARDCIGKMTNLKDLVRKVDNCENLGNSLERKMIKTIFTVDSLKDHSGRRVIQKELVNEVGAICDKCKHAMEKISITAIKRRV